MSESKIWGVNDEIASLELKGDINALNEAIKAAQAAIYRVNNKRKNALLKNVGDAIKAVYDAGGYVEIFDNDETGIRIEYYEDILEHLEFIIPD